MPLLYNRSNGFFVMRRKGEDPFLTTNPDTSVVLNLSADLSITFLLIIEHVANGGISGGGLTALMWLSSRSPGLVADLSC